MARSVFKSSNPYYNLIYKLGAVGLAVILWFFSISDSQFSAEVEFPIEIRNIKEGKTLSEAAPPNAVLLFRGTGRSLAKLYLFKPFYKSSIVLDLERVQQRHVFYLDEYLLDNTQRIILPQSVEGSVQFVEVVRPDSIEIVLSDFKEKQVPVRPQITLVIASGYTQVGNMVITPPLATVKGPVEAVDQVQEVLTSRRTYSDVSAPLDIFVGLWDPNPGKGLAIEPLNVTLNIDIQMIGERQFTEVPVNIINIPEDLDVIVAPSTVAIKVNGGVDYLADLDSIATNAIEVYVDYRTQWSPESLFVEPQVRLDSNLLDYKDLNPKQLEIITTRPSP